jgi:hypothetical protein
MDEEWREIAGYQCPHDLAERETACADGLCPLCLQSEVQRLEGENRHYNGQLKASRRLGLELEAILAQKADDLHETLADVRCLEMVNEKHEAAITAIQSERDRLREALEKIADWDSIASTAELGEVARAALAGKD